MKTPKSKHCGTCHKRKSLKLFHKDPRRTDGRETECKDCKHRKNKQRYQAKKINIYTVQ